jgi:hypothetical protein
MKLESAVSKIFTNKWVLNIVSFLALFNVIGHMVIGNYNLVVYFILLALLVRYFSKNMIVVLGVPLILVNIVSMNGNYVEGMEVAHEKEGEKKGMDGDKKKSTTENMEVAEEEEVEEFEVGRNKNRVNKPRIDYATTIEDAYDQLNSILGKDGIKNLTADTERLMKQQQQLAGSLKDMGPLMKQMGPMMEQAKEMMASMGPGGAEGLQGQLQELMGNLTTAKKDLPAGAGKK